MTNSTISSERTARAIEQARTSVTVFKQILYRRYRRALHLDQLDRALIQASRYVETGGRAGVGRLIITMPPRHGKTLTVSRFYPAWHLGRNPDNRVMLVSYGADLSDKNSRMARNLIRAPYYQAIFPGVALADDSRAVDSWDLAREEGGADALGVGGGATGKGAHLLIVDDPIKNREQAESETWREKVWDSYTDDLYTRLEPSGAVIVMATRWHEDDLIGRLLKNQPGRWRVLNMPAVAEANDPFGRPLGAALWPERYPLNSLHDIEVTLGPYSWSALYQQRPTPAEGGIFKRAWFTRVSRPPVIAYAVRYWDLAMSEKTSADFTAGVKVGIGEDGHRYVLDVAHERVDWGDLTEFLAQRILSDGPNVAQGIENKGYMSRAVQALNVDPRLHGYQVWGYDVDRDKLTRALPAAAKAASGVVHVVDSHWTDAFLDELCSFPSGAHDDMVDAFAGAEIMLGSGMTSAVGGISYGTDDYATESPY